MTKKVGHEYKAFVDNGSGTFNPIIGEVNHGRDVSTGFLDQSSKGTGQYTQKTPLRKDLTLKVSGVVELPDPGGLERVKTLEAASPQVPANWQLRKSPYSGSDVIFACSMYIGNLSIQAPDQGNYEFSFDLTNASLTGPTVDLIG